jgi:hypothetical protein
MEESIFNKLEAIRDLKVDDLNHWLGERIIDIRTVAADEDIRMLEFIREGNEEYIQTNLGIAAKARDLLSGYLKNYDELSELFVVNPSTKKVLVSSDLNNEGKERLIASEVTASKQHGGLYIEGVKYGPNQKDPRLAFPFPFIALWTKGP